MKRGAKLKARRVPKAFRQRRDPQYARWVRTQPCVLIGRFRVIEAPAFGEYHQCSQPGRVQSCHVRSRAAAGDDRGNLFPCCAWGHHQQHMWGIKTFQARWGLDLKDIAARLFAAYQRETGAPQ